ncbi:MAG: hypothetical protein HYX68_15580 [Planctomycetes bacterium]|jgi:hypothetical protein|nr:hypothetical protein [Planctomycetota bacterium]
MDRQPDERSPSRENLLGIALVMLVGSMFLFFLYLISLGIVGNVLAGGGILVLVVALHYLVWGRNFSAQVAAERETIRRQELGETNIKTKIPPEAIQDLARTQGIKSNKTPE